MSYIYRFFNFIKNLFSKNDPKPSLPVPPVVSSDKPKIIIGDIKTSGPLEDDMVLDAIDNVRKVVYSPEFKDAILWWGFTGSNGLSNLQIYEKFTQNSITINVTMFTGSFMQNKVWKTQGLDNGTGVVFANRYFIDNAFDLGSLILHEVAHSLGFSHQSASDTSSVPYAMNEIFESVGKKLGLK